MTVIVAALAAYLGWAQLDLDAPGVLVVASAAALAWSLFAAIFWPFAMCPVIGCDKGKLRRSGKRTTWRKCGWCGGSGARVRWARRLYDEVRPSKHRSRR